MTQKLKVKRCTWLYNCDMKNVVFVMLFVLICFMAKAQVTIQMEKDAGVYKVPCVVNGVKMKFVFDTGASSVSMSQTMAQFLYDGDYLSASDIKGSGQSSLADGSIVDHTIIVLRDIEVGGLHLHDIRATVIDSQNAPLLLGQTAISELGVITIDGNRLIIHSANSGLTDAQIRQLKEQAQGFYDSESYAAAIDCFVRIDEAVGLTEYELYLLCNCYRKIFQYELCIQSCKRWLDEYEMTGSVYRKGEVYDWLGYSYDLGQNDYYNAMLYYQKDLGLLESGAVVYKNKLEISLKADRNMDIGLCYYYLDKCYSAIPYFKKAIQLGCEYINTSMKDVKEGKVKDGSLGMYLYFYAKCYYKMSDEDEGDEVMKLSALCGNQDAIDFCRKYDMNYQSKTNKLFE